MHTRSTLSRIRARFRDDFSLVLLALPAIVYLIAFNYLPMYGVIVAFKNYNYIDGIVGSSWAGLKYFEYFFTSNDAAAVVRNTLLYNLLFIFLGQFLGIIVALCLYEVRSRKALKFYQTATVIPYFISWVLVAYIGFALFSNENGVINAALRSFGLETINWYAEPKYWPVILTLAQIWKTVGMGCIIYYAALMGLDSELFEAATLDGAGRFKQVLYISIPSLLPLISVLLIMALGNVMGGDFGLFFQLPRDSGALYPATDVINTYLYRSLQSGNMSQTAAVGLFQSGVGLVLVMFTNFSVRKISPENSLF